MAPRSFNLARQRIRRLYNWTLHWAETPQSTLALFFIALIESSIFPIPPDVLLIAIVAAKPSAWLLAAGVCSIGSLLGAIVGYEIGFTFMTSLGEPIIAFYGASDDWTRFLRLADRWGMWFLAAAAFTPIPFKVATIASGAAGLPFLPFVLISAIGRIFGPKVRALLERHFDVATVLFICLLIGGFAVLRLF
jgi:membrane protein YqaA with SNARE-associated domain